MNGYDDMGLNMICEALVGAADGSGPPLEPDEAERMVGYLHSRIADWTPSHDGRHRYDRAMRERVLATLTLTQGLAGASILSQDPADYPGITTRTRNCLANMGVREWADVIEMTDARLLKGRNLGRKSLREIDSILAEHGLRRIPPAWASDLDEYRKATEPTARSRKRTL